MDKLKKKIKQVIKSIIRTVFPEHFVCKKNYESFIEQRGLHERMQDADFLDLLKTVHIETRTRCNSTCSYCSANPKFDRREDSSMPEETYRRIIDGLAEIKYNKRVSPYCNNEPLLDENIYSYIAYAKEKLPEATIELKTNGTVLDEKKLKQLFDSGLDKLYVNDYQVSDRLSERLSGLYDKYKNLYKGKLSFGRSLYSDQTGRINRAGNNPAQAELSEPKQYFCYRPFEMTVFSVDGRMTSCSNDFYLENNIGNINDASLKELFTGDRVQALRRSLLDNDRSSFTACRRCDYLGISTGHDYSCRFKFLLPFYS